jgi:S-adenosylmethionine synthetase
MKYLFDDDLILYVNPTWKFVIWWPNGDTGLTWRKIIVDTYGWKWAHWGWAFSGKDPSKVDRSAAYAARHIAKNIVAAWISDEVLVQVAYAIWVASPVSLYINTYWKAKVWLTDAEIAKRINKIFDMRPNAIAKRFNLQSPIYLETATYGHMGRKPRTVTKVFEWKYLNWPIEKEVELFPREKLDYVDRLKNEFYL